MKTLILLRHALTEPGTAAGDKSRRLTPAGVREAKTVGQALGDVLPDAPLILHSDAVRTAQTASYLYEALKNNGATTLAEPRLYNVSAAVILERVAHVDGVDALVVVGHNPGISDACGALLHRANVSDGVSLPLNTATGVSFSLDIDDWSEWETAEVQKARFVCPAEVAI